MLSRKETVLNTLDRLGIEYELYEHPPLHTIEEAMVYWKEIDSTHCKNLFFRNHKGNRHYLVVFEWHRQLAIHDLEQVLKQGKISFASEQRMEKYLGVAPGSVSPFGLINDPGRHVKLFLDSCLRQAERLSFHPNDNTGSVIVSNAGFMRFLQHWGGEYEFIDLFL